MPAYISKEEAAFADAYRNLVAAKVEEGLSLKQAARAVRDYIESPSLKMQAAVLAAFGKDAASLEASRDIDLQQALQDSLDIEPDFVDGYRKNPLAHAFAASKDIARRRQGEKGDKSISRQAGGHSL